jgi:DNA (cytosine-5)-methyltransferase 1
MKKNQQNNNKYKIVSLFAGCGGLDLGFTGGFEYLNKLYQKRNFDIIWANDIDAPSCNTFAKNFHSKIVCDDIRDILFGKKQSLFNDVALPQKADVVLGGFPCQDFSVAGKRLGLNSKRGNLYKAMAEVIKRLRPALFVAENVKGLTNIDNGDVLKKIERDFNKLGYSISTKLYHAADYGVPQTRERVIIVGTDKKRGLPKFKHPDPLLKKDKWITLGRAISDLENKKEGELANHYWSKAKMFKGTQGNSYVSKNKVGPTMRAEHHGNIEWHWNKKRRLSAREAARIQSFPDNFIFYPSTSSAYKQIGNAVPPVMAWHIAKSIEEFLNNNLK